MRKENVTDEEMLEIFKTAARFAHDFENTQKCFSLLRNYNREQACVVVSEIVTEYAVQVNIFGFFVDGARVDYSKQFDFMSDDQIKRQLHYLKNHIPVYAFLKQSEEELTRRMVSYLTGGQQ